MRKIAKYLIRTRKRLRFSEDVSKVAKVSVTGARGTQTAGPTNIPASIGNRRYILHSRVTFDSLVMRHACLQGPSSSTSMVRCHTVTVRGTRTRPRLRTAPALSMRSHVFARALACLHLITSLSVRARGHDRAHCQPPAASSLVALPALEAR